MSRHRIEIDPADLASIEADWRAGILSARQIAAKHRRPPTMIRERMVGIPRDVGAAKREIVRAGASGLQGHRTGMEQRVHAMVAQEAMRDIDAMSCAAQGALAILQRAMGLASQADARDLSALAAAQRNALETWRRSRELDDPAGQQTERRIVLVDAPRLAA